jgi:AraC-like DNA-binding protein
LYKSIKNYFEYYPTLPEDAIWGYRLSASGHTSFRAGAAYPPPRHPPEHAFTWERGRRLSAMQLVGIRSGAGLLEWEDNHQELGPGDCFVLCPGVWHRYRPDTAVGWTEDWFELRGRVMDALMPGPFAGHPVVHIPINRPFWQQFADFHRICGQRSRASHGIAAGHARALFAEVCAAMNPGEPDPAEVRFYASAREALLAGHPVADIASSMGMSYPRFHRRFKAVAGLPPKEYHAQVRHSRAEALLLGNRLSIKEIAAQLGFHSPAHFSVEFKKRSAQSPSAWLRRNSTA